MQLDVLIKASLNHLSHAIKIKVFRSVMDILTIK